MLTAFIFLSPLVLFRRFTLSPDPHPRLEGFGNAELTASRGIRVLAYQPAYINKQKSCQVWEEYQKMGIFLPSANSLYYKELADSSASGTGGLSSSSPIQFIDCIKITHGCQKGSVLYQNNPHMSIKSGGRQRYEIVVTEPLVSKNLKILEIPGISQFIA
jgi:hypothetical protein